MLDSAPLPLSLKACINQHMIFTGIALASVNAVLRGHGMRSENFTAVESCQAGILKFRDHVQTSMDPSQQSWVAVNYSRGALGQVPATNGHLSPIGGYHPATDRVLILDTNTCLLYTSDAADEEDSVDLGGRRIIKKKKKKIIS
eukprot:TRINITY_DN2075_c0_g1_i19.p2 TRINITY_DN2075_c0_g1~~TRINITY_DN2075_c0_g1_i19.p2  ORF type:complete len:144 (-),score=35.04 TRINITY_DN2075_c0_g1_i19:119-550(-)